MIIKCRTFCKIGLSAEHISEYLTEYLTRSPEYKDNVVLEEGEIARWKIKRRVLKRARKELAGEAGFYRGRRKPP